MKTLYVSDLDGTLLRGSAVLSPYSLHTLNALIADGIPFAVASARSIYSIQDVLKGLNLRLPVIECNGGFLTDLKTRNHTVVNAFEPDLVPELHALIEEYEGEPFYCTFDGKRDHLYYRNVLNSGMEAYITNRLDAKDPRLEQLHEWKRPFGEQTVYIVLVDHHENLVPLAKRIERQYSDRIEMTLFQNIYQPEYYWLTLHDKTASKDQAIRTLMEREGLSDHELVVFGDQTNDLPMFATADRSYAVTNAIDTLKAKAHAVIGSNEDDAVARFMLEETQTRAALQS